MTTDITGADSQHLLDEGWSTPLEAGVRGTIRGFIETLIEEELEVALGRARYARLKTAAGARAAAAAGLGNEEDVASAVPSTGHRNGRRERQVMGSFGAVTVAVPRARLDTAYGGTTEWVNKTLPAYRRRTREVDALIAGAYLAGTNTRRVGRALTAIFRGAISKYEAERLLDMAVSLRDRVMLSLGYGCGLRAARANARASANGHRLGRTRAIRGATRCTAESRLSLRASYPD